MRGGIESPLIHFGDRREGVFPVCGTYAGMVKIKICGITRAEDAFTAVEAGADFIGINFYPESPRYVPPETAARMIHEIGKRVKWVGVFVNERLESVREISSRLGLDLVQLHGDETPEFCRNLGIPAVKAFRIRVREDLEGMGDYPSRYLLLDHFSPGYGGSGSAFDWSWLEEYEVPRERLFLAGGLTPGNVAEAVRRVRPFAVDVASGVESGPGVKDRTLIEMFIRNCRGSE